MENTVQRLREQHEQEADSPRDLVGTDSRVAHDEAEDQRIDPGVRDLFERTELLRYYGQPNLGGEVRGYWRFNSGELML